jgi:hypothetical protein
VVEWGRVLLAVGGRVEKVCAEFDPVAAMSCLRCPQCAVACHRDAEVLLTDNDPSVGRLSAAGVLSSSLTWWLTGQRGRRARGMRLDDDAGPVQHEKDRDH